VQFDGARGQWGRGAGFGHDPHVFDGVDARRGVSRRWAPENLLEQVWDEHADPFTNTVTVTIGRLRRKLGDPPVITTAPGVGYRIADQPGTCG
jgi:Transcriptional regulatory protein, C terminal